MKIIILIELKVLRKSVSLELSEFLTQTPPSPPGSILVLFNVVGLFPHVLFRPTRAHIDELLAEATYVSSMTPSIDFLLT